MSKDPFFLLHRFKAITSQTGLFRQPWTYSYKPVLGFAEFIRMDQYG